MDVEKVVHDQIASMVAAGHEASRFTVAAAPAPPVLADPDKLRQILANLLENAVRYSKGRIKIEIVAAQGHGDAVAVSVDDDGPGIPEELLERIFTQFWRGSRQGGTGLGLFIVKGIIEAHGGTITASRSSSGGARFRFTLPTAQANPRSTSMADGYREADLRASLN